METSVRKALKFAAAAGSVEARFKKAKMTAVPKSLRALMNAFSPETLTFRSDMTLNDVSTHSTLKVHSNGDYEWTGWASDDGLVLGDVYSLSVSLTRASPDNQTFALSHQGEMGAGEKASWSQPGGSAWLRDHWDLVKASDARWRLTQRAEIGTLINLIFGTGSISPAPTGQSSGLLGGG